MDPTTRPVVLAAHGTADARGIAELECIRAAVAARLDGPDVALGYVDVAEPHIGSVLRDHPNAVVAPLFVTAGFHVRSDLPGIIAAVAPTAVTTVHLGALDGYVEALAARVLEAAVPADSAALVVAGSSDEAARAEADALGEAVGRRLGCAPLPVAHLSGPGRPLDDLDPSPALLVSTLLAPGFFQTRLESWGRDHSVTVTGPVGADPAVISAIASALEQVRP